MIQGKQTRGYKNLSPLEANENRYLIRELCTAVKINILIPLKLITLNQLMFHQ